MQVTPSGEPAFFAFQDVPYDAGQHWVYWDGRRPDGSIVDSSVYVFYPTPTLLRQNTIQVLGTTPNIAGLGEIPDIEIKSDPYLISHSYEQVSKMVYRIDLDAYVTVKLLPPGIIDPTHPDAIVVLDRELQSAVDVGDAPIDHTVEWRGLASPDSNDVLTADEGVFTFVIEAESVLSGQTGTYRGVLSIRR